MRTLSLRARLTLWYTLALLLVLSVFGATVVWQQERVGIRRVDRELDAVTSTLANVLADELTEMPNRQAAAVEAQHTMAVPDLALAIIDGNGTGPGPGRGSVLAAQWNGLRLPIDTLGGIDGPRAWSAVSADGAWRVHVRPVSAEGTTFRLLVAAPLTDVLRERQEAEEAMWIAIPVMLILAAGGGLWLASVGLGPIAEMAERAAALAPTGMEDLGQSARQDELGQLARAFNGLVARLRAALQTQRQFMADASHELRTPVSVIQSAADVTLAREHRDESEYRDALAIAGTQARRLGRLVENMLVLARADAGGYPLHRVSLYLNELIAECRQTVDVLAKERGVSVHTPVASTPVVSDVAYYGDEDLLRRMLLNLIQNAIQHTPAGGAVTIDLSPGRQDVTIHVIDEGPGIPEADRVRIFDRFVQLDAARRSAGAGLGLPIARWIATAHGGTLELEQSGGTGSSFRIVLPLTADS